MDNGNKVEKYTIKAYPYDYGKPVLVYEGQTIGHKAICRFPSLYSEKIEMIVEKSSGLEKINEMSIYFV